MGVNLGPKEIGAIGKVGAMSIGQTFTTSRLNLVPFQSNDLQILHQLFIHPFIRKHLWDNRVVNQQETTSILQENEVHFAENRWGLWQIRLQNEAEPIGFVGLWFFFDEPQPQLIYGLLPNFCGKGYAAEASQCILHYSFDHLRFSYIDAAMDQNHMSSIKVAKRLGMSLLKTTEHGPAGTLFYRIYTAG